ncbi:S9 family peptidase [Temperatibacter marinus]|uniref:S9 family peptidase n=1 Tax=Temperatibacter marinus TaxID=1456591 RepID=A0AA52EHT7_9PROT|nr:S9 family peptidase [Temperatibacter marinus]WND03423.1 S9 family peptidase [Temperatibacter marinus]
MNSASLIAGLLFFAATTSTPALAEESQRKFKSADIFNLEHAEDPRLSPDGQSIVFVRRQQDIMADRSRSNLWITDKDGKDLRPLFTGNNSYYSPRWSPSGKQLAFLSNKEGRTQLFVRWMDTGQIAQLTHVQQGLGNISWSPDGRTIAFTMRVTKKERPLKVKMPKKPRGATWSKPVQYVSKARYQADGRGIMDPSYTHIFTIPAIGGTPTQLTKGDYPRSGSFSWAQDGSSIYYSANRSDNWEYETRESNLYNVTLSGKREQITDEPGSEYSPRVSPDGRSLAYIKSDNKKLAFRPAVLMVRDIHSSKTKSITHTLDRRVRNIQWDSRSKGLYYQYTNRGLTHVGFSDVAKANHSVKAEDIGGTTLGRPYLSGTYHTNGKALTYTKGTAKRPADLYYGTGKSEKRLTELNHDVLSSITLGETKEIIYKSSIDGEEIQGWYILPPNYDPSKKYPLILEIHGGPHLAYGPHFTAELQRFSAEGYIVFFDNHRGSTGYGERFALLLQNKYSSEYDFADHMSGIDALIEKGLVDENRLFIAGGSAGGIASAYAIGLTDRFKAAVVAKPVINWISKVLTADSYLFQIPNQFPGMPWDHVEHYWKRSPLSLVGNVKTPTMLITGEADRRTPISETEQYYQALKLLKVDTVMVRVPDSPHGIAARPSRMIAKIENIIAWFNKYDGQEKE